MLFRIFILIHEDLEYKDRKISTTILHLFYVHVRIFWTQEVQLYFQLLVTRGSENPGKLTPTSPFVLSSFCHAAAFCGKQDIYKHPPQD